MRQADELGPARGSTGVKQRAHGRPIRARIKGELVRLAGHRRLEADISVAEAAISAYNQDRSERVHARDDIAGFFPDTGFVFLRRDDENRGALCREKISDRILIQEVIYRAGHPCNLSPQERGKNLWKYGAKECRGSGAGLDSQRPEEIRRSRNRAEKLTMSEADFAFCRTALQHGQSRPIRMQPGCSFE